MSSTESQSIPLKESEITIYGATSFVAKHVLRYLLAVTCSAGGQENSPPIRITLAGRNFAKLLAVKDHPEFRGSVAISDVYVASGSDLDLLKKMATRTGVVINCAGPYAQYSNFVVQACAETGTDYVDFTGEAYWSATMRQKHGAAAEKSGARIISMCGYDSIPSDLAVFAAVDALRAKLGNSGAQSIQEIKLWHQAFGMANGGTIHTLLDYEWDVKNDFTKAEKQGRSIRRIPFFVGDPLLLTHPVTVRHNPDYDGVRSAFALGEWLNQLISIERNFSFGVSMPMPMSPVNLKVVQASAVALKYGDEKLSIRERYLPLGFQWTQKLSLLAFFPLICLHLGMLAGAGLLRLPKIGKRIADLLSPPGSGAPDWLVNLGSCSVYAVVTAPQSSGNLVDRGYAYISFQGDPGNAVTAQCVCEAALTLLLDREKLPPRSIDGFGTPSELLGSALLERFRDSNIRPIKIKVTTRLGTDKNETTIFT